MDTQAAAQGGETTPSGTAPAVIRVAAVAMARPDGKVLAVRKSGTTRFMFPGGKPHPGEQPLDTALRELAEETGLRVRPDELDHLGSFVTDAANEPGTELRSEVFGLWRPIARHEVPEPTAEIVQLAWLDPADPQAPDGHGLAPLLQQVLARIAQNPLF